jgi:hypothetical protein
MRISTKIWNKTVRLFYLSTLMQRCAGLHCFFFFFFFDGTGVHTQGFTLAWQVLYCLSHIYSPFFFVYFRVGSHFCSGWPGPQSSYFILPTIAGWQAHTTTPSFFLLRWGLMNFCMGWPWTTIFPITVSQVAKIIGVSYCSASAFILSQSNKTRQRNKGTLLGKK